MIVSDALCRQSDPDLWFPDQGGDAAIKARRAKAICRRCPVRAACAQAALDGNETHGIWAGELMSARSTERWAALDRLRRVAAGSAAC